MRTPGYLVARALVEGASEDKTLTRAEIRRLLTLAVLAPKDIDSLLLPENTWLITGIALSESATGSRQSIKGVNALQALIALAKIDGHFQTAGERSPSGRAQHECAAESLENPPLYIDLLEQELAILKANLARESSPSL
jgi:hypothetical protein